MQTFINDFGIFFNKIFECMTSLFNWFTGTVIGEIFIFIIIISLFFFLINLFVDFKD